MTTVGTECFIRGGKVVCPADSSITYDGGLTQIDAELICPMDAVAQSDYIRASQQGLCDCATALLGTDPNDPPEAIPCNCFACPLGSRIGFAFQCDVPIVGPCFNFSCGGDCNGDIGINIDQDTFSPTMAPTVFGSGATMAGGSGMILPAMIAGFLLFKVMH